MHDLLELAENSVNLVVQKLNLTQKSYDIISNYVLKKNSHLKCIFFADFPLF